MKNLDLVGLKFGKLTAIKKMGKTKWGHILWECLCDCGNKTIVSTQKLKIAHTKSCGCLKFERFKNIGSHHKHGHHCRSYASPTYISWQSMLNRCLNPKHPAYKNYKDRTVCERWKKDFRLFLEDMGERPPGLTLHRINNDLGYFKGNCKWATYKEQNQKMNKKFLLNGGRNILQV